MKLFTELTIITFLATLCFAGAAFGAQIEGKSDEVQLRISAKQLSSDQVRELQLSLQDEGFDPGPVDGIMGPKTRQALREFQRHEDLAATGDINEGTLEALDIEVQEFMGLSPEFAGEGRDEAQLRISAQQLNKAQVRELQKSLQRQGIDPGPIDGIMGDLTRQAIQLFQQEHGLAATGDINERTLDALDIEVQEFMGLSPRFE